MEKGHNELDLVYVKVVAIPALNFLRKLVIQVATCEPSTIVVKDTQFFFPRLRITLTECIAQLL